MSTSQIPVIHCLSFPFISIVHLCRRRNDGAFVILKEIPVEQMSRDERLAAQNECQVLKLLNHPNIIEYYENFLEDKALMIAMEYAPGKPAALFQRGIFIMIKGLYNIFCFKC